MNCDRNFDDRFAWADYRFDSALRDQLAAQIKAKVSSPLPANLCFEHLHAQLVRNLARQQYFQMVEIS